LFRRDERPCLGSYEHQAEHGNLRSRSKKANELERLHDIGLIVEFEEHLSLVYFAVIEAWMEEEEQHIMTGMDWDPLGGM